MAFLIIFEKMFDSIGTPHTEELWYKSHLICVLNSIMDTDTLTT